MRQPARPQRVAPVRAGRSPHTGTPPRATPDGPVTTDTRPGGSVGASAATPGQPLPVASRGSAPTRTMTTPGDAIRVAGAAPAGWQPVRPPVVSDGSAARFAERAAMRRRIATTRIAIAFTCVTVAGALGWVLLASPLLALDVAKVEIQGQGTVVDAAAVAAVVQAHDGTPLPRLDTVALRRAVLDVPGVRAAEVGRVWPHGLLITVVSREPVAAVPWSDGGFALLDLEGVQVGRVDAAPEGLPVIDVPLDDPEARAMTAVLTVLQQLPPELAAEIATASAATQDTVTFGLRGGAVVEWGSADQSALKARVLQTLRAAAASMGAAVFDVSAPTLPITQS